MHTSSCGKADARRVRASPFTFKVELIELHVAQGSSVLSEKEREGVRGRHEEMRRPTDLRPARADHLGEAVSESDGVIRIGDRALPDAGGGAHLHDGPD